MKTAGTTAERGIAARLPFLRRSAAVLFVRATEVGGKLALYLLAAAVLGLEQSGLFLLCLTWTVMLSTVARLGLDKAMMRHVAAELAVGDVRAARRAIVKGMTWTALAAAATGLATWLLAEPLARSVFRMEGLAPALALSGLVIVAQTLCFSLCAVLTGLNRTVLAQALQHALWPLLTVSSLAFGIDRAQDLVLVLAAAFGVSLALAALFVLRERGRRLADAAAAPVEARPGTGSDPLPPLARTARALFVVETVQVAVGNLPVLFLGVLATAEEVGAFSVAVRTSMLIWIVIISIGTIVSPNVAERHRLGDWEELGRINRSARRLAGWCGGILAIAMMLFAETLLGLIGEGFEMGTTALRILALGQLVNAVLSCQDVVLAMTGHGPVLRRLNILQLGACMLLCGVLMPPFGLIGAAIASAIATAQGAIGTTLAVRALMPRAALPEAPALGARLSGILLGRHGRRAVDGGL